MITEMEMEMEKGKGIFCKSEEEEEEEVLGVNLVKVMSEEQLEQLRYQISVYVTLSQQLIHLHNFTSHQQHLPVMKLGSIDYDPLMAYGGHKTTTRQRWSPTPKQLQILERIFGQGNGTPNKQKIKEITTEVSQHGQISETNVYNWFQNRRARSKRKQTVATTRNNSELEVEAKQEDAKFFENYVKSSNDHLYFSSTEELINWSENEGIIGLQHDLPSWSGFGVEEL